MYSRNTKNPPEGYEYSFTLPERYGGSRFRPMKEPKVHVYTETAVPQTPSPIHLSPAVAEIVQEEKPILLSDTISDITAEEILEEGESLPVNENASSPEETKKTTDENPPVDASVSTGTSGTGLPFSGLDGEDLLLLGLILLLSREGEDSAELPALLALLLAYRPSENK